MMRIRQISPEEAVKRPCVLIALPTKPYGPINFQPAVLEMYIQGPGIWDDPEWKEVPIKLIGKEDGGKD